MKFSIFKHPIIFGHGPQDVVVVFETSIGNVLPLVKGERDIPKLAK